MSKLKFRYTLHTINKTYSLLSLFTNNQTLLHPNIFYVIKLIPSASLIPQLYEYVNGRLNNKTSYIVI